MARRAVIQLEIDGTGDVRADLERVGQSLDEVEVEAIEAGDGFSRLSGEAQRELAETRAQAARTATSMDRVSTSARGSANSLGIELTQAAQDASFGVAGVANQLPQLQMEFQRLQSQTGSTTGALSQLGSAFVGPTGVLAAGTLLLQWWPQIVSAFDDAEESAKEAAEQVERLSEATSAILEVEGDLPTGQLGLEEARALNREIQEQNTAIESQLDFAERLRNAYRDVRETRRQVQTLEELEEENELDEQQRQVLSRQRDELEQQLATLRDLREQSQFVLGLQVSSEETAEQQLQRLRTRLEEGEGVAQQLQGRVEELNREEQQLNRLRQVASELGIEVEFQKEQQEQAADATERQAEAYNALAVSAKQAAQNAQTVGRFMQQRGMTQTQRQLQAFGQQRMPTIGGTMLNQGRSQGALMLQSAQQAGILSGPMGFGDVFSGGGQSGEPSGLEAMNMSLDEIQDKFDVSRDKAEQFKQAAQSRFGQVANAAASMGSALVQALQGGKKEANEIAGILLQGVGGVLSAIPGVGTIAGPVLSGAGGLIGSFQHGGRVNTPFQIVGERGPELAALPHGTQVHSSPDTEELLRSTSGAQSDPIVQKLDEVARRVESMSLNVDTYRLVSEINRIQTEKDEFRAT